MRQNRIDLLRRENGLVECPCCFEEEVLPEEMLSCPAGHSFCEDCVKRYVKSQIGKC